MHRSSQILIPQPIHLQAEKLVPQPVTLQPVIPPHPELQVNPQAMDYMRYMQNLQLRTQLDYA
jgi:hypothetical protein